MQELHTNNLPLAILYLIVISVIARSYANRKKTKNYVYKYFLVGLLVKLFGCISFCLLYSFYYDGGDTGAYFENSRALVRLFFQEPKISLKLIFDSGELKYDYLRFFNDRTGYLHIYMFRDESSFFVSRLSTIFSFFGLNYFVPTSLLICTFSYLGIWKFFLMVNKLYPNNLKYLTFTILYVPSFVFGGLG